MNKGFKGQSYNQGQGRGHTSITICFAPVQPLRRGLLCCVSYVMQWPGAAEVTTANLPHYSPQAFPKRHARRSIERNKPFHLSRYCGLATLAACPTWSFIDASGRGQPFKRDAPPTFLHTSHVFSSPVSCDTTQDVTQFWHAAASTTHGTEQHTVPKFL